MDPMWPMLSSVGPEPQVMPAAVVFVGLSATSFVATSVMSACVSALKTLGISDEALHEVTTAVANEAATSGVTQHC